MSFNLRVINDAGLGILAEATSGHSVILDYAYAWPNAPSYSESQLKNAQFEPGLPGYIVSRKITISGTDTSTNTARIVAAFDAQASEVRANLSLFMRIPMLILQCENWLFCMIIKAAISKFSSRVLM